MPASSKRAIDHLPSVSPRPREMDVLCLGLSRTATMSQHEALSKLGYRAYHMKEVGQMDLPDENHIDCWREAFITKMYGRGPPYGKEEFDKLLRNYSAVTDAPCVCFADELMAAYPNAKVILSTRDVDKWIDSMNNAYYKILSSTDWRWFRAVCAFDVDFLGPYLDLLRFPLRFWTNDDWEDRQKLRESFVNHYAHIREVVPKENLLEWVPKDGYAPICEFLGKPNPADTFPHINRGDAAANLHKPLAWTRAVQLLAPFFKWPGLATMVLLGAWWYGKRAS